MQNSTSTIIALLVAGVLIFITPLMTLANRNDNVTQENVKLIVDKFVAEVVNTGKLTRAQYQDLVNELDSTGNTYDIEIVVQELDENPGKKTSQSNYTKIGENLYVVKYNTQILPQIGIAVDGKGADPAKDTMLLKRGDYVYVEVKNNSSTTAQTLQSSFIGFSNADEYVIYASKPGMVDANGVKD